MMDLEEKSAEHPAQDETIIALKLILSYAQYGLIPLVIPPLAHRPAVPIERIPVQQGTDLDYLDEMAAALRLRLLRRAGPAPGHQHRLLGTADPRRPAAARALGQHGRRDQRRARSTSSTTRWPRPWSPARCRTARPNQTAAGADVRQPALPPLSLQPAWLVEPAERAHASSCRETRRSTRRRRSPARRPRPTRRSTPSRPRASSTRCATATCSSRAGSSACAAPASATTASTTSRA